MEVCADDVNDHHALVLGCVLVLREHFQCRYGYPMDIIHPCGLWMYRGMREMIVECWCVNLRKVWSHAVLVCIVHVVCTTVQNTQIYCDFYFRVFMLPSQMIHEDGGSRSKGSPAGNSLKKIKPLCTHRHRPIIWTRVCFHCG